MLPHSRSLVRPRPQPLLEELESRTLLSASVMDASNVSTQVITPQGTLTVDPQRQGDSGPTNTNLLSTAPILTAPGTEIEPTPTLSAEEARENMLPCDACFLDEIGVALMGEQALALLSNDTEGSFTFRVPQLALYGLVASSLWLTPDAAQEAQKRRDISL